MPNTPMLVKRYSLQLPSKLLHMLISDVTTDFSIDDTDDD